MVNVQNKKVKILATVGVALITIGVVTNFVMNLKSDKKEVNHRMEIITGAYEIFKTNANNFSQLRDDLYTDVFSEIYYETLKENIEIYKTKLKEYETTLEQVEKEALTLEKNCQGIYYPEASINTKCTTFAKSYEEMVNYFVNDVMQVNKNIEEYNKYQTENATGNILLEKYSTTKKYIDFNKDKKYEGKEEVS